MAVTDIPQWNVYGPETPGSIEVCHFFDPLADSAGKTQATLRSVDAERGVSIKFNKNQLPCFTIWKNRQATIDGYVTGLEPGTNFPNQKSFEKQQGRVVMLKPGESPPLRGLDRSPPGRGFAGRRRKGRRGNSRQRPARNLPAARPKMVGPVRARSPLPLGEG